MQLLIKNVQLESGFVYENQRIVGTQTQLKDIFIEDGKFKQIKDNIDVKEVETVNAQGQLLLPSLKEMHVHIDKTYFGAEWSAGEEMVDGIFTRLKEERTMLPDMLKNAENLTHNMIRYYISKGHTHIRTHVNVDPTIGLQHMEKTKRVLDYYKDQITYEIVAFPQHGLLRNGEEFLKLFEKALAMGATHVGGVDPANMDQNIKGNIKQTFDYAEKYNLDIDFHLHDPDTLGAFEIEQIIDEIESRRFKGSVTIGHAFSLAAINKEKLEIITQRLAKNKVDLTSSIAIGDVPITIPIDYLYDNGVPVSLGHDSLIDHWSPFGTADTIQKLNLVAKRFNWTDEADLRQALRYATGGITPLNNNGDLVWPQIGDTVDAILVDAVSTAHLIARQGPITTVLSKGNIIHRNEIELKGANR